MTAHPSLAHYRILEKLGQGGMGVVFKARDTRLGRLVAIKLLRGSVSSDPERRARFLREARAAARLNHGNIATVYEVGSSSVGSADVASVWGAEEPISGEVLYIAMEYVEGEDLHSRLGGPALPLGDTLDFSIQIAEALEAAHRGGVIHRDLKPRNIRITPQGKVKILDFGLAKVMEERPDDASQSEAESFETLQGMIVGTVPYMAPEQLRGVREDSRSDLFALGVILYQMITGRLPFASTSLLDFLKALAEGEPEAVSKSNVHVSAQWDGIVSKLLKKDPQERYQSAQEVGTDLRRLPPKESFATPAPAAQVSEEAFHAVHSRGVQLAVTGALAMGIVVVLWLWVAQLGERPPGVRTVLVAPFENFTDFGDAPVCKGIGWSLKNRLADAGIVVASPSEASTRGRGGEWTAVAKELGVAIVLEGGCQDLAESGTRLDVRLTDAETGLLLWSKTFSGRQKAPYLEAEMTFQIARGLAVPLSQRQQRRLRQESTRYGSAGALNAYRRGLDEMEEAEAAGDLERAGEKFVEAIDLDDGFALAHARLSDVKLQLHSRTREARLLRQAEAAARRAVELDPELPEARIAWAGVLRARGEYDLSAAELEQVLGRNPAHVEVYLPLAEIYRAKDQLQDAIDGVRKALEVRPNYWSYWNELGAYLWDTSRYAEARQAFERSTELAPSSITTPLQNLGGLKQALGHIDDAIATYERIPRPITRGSLATNMGVAYFVKGELSRAEEYFRLAIDLEPRRPGRHVNLGDALMAQGKEGEARGHYQDGLKWLNEDFKINRHPSLLSLSPLLHAKVDDCEAALREGERLESELPEIASYALRLAKAYAVCHQPDRALAKIRQALDLGAAPSQIRQLYEFRHYLGQAEFEDLLSNLREPPRREP